MEQTSTQANEQIMTTVVMSRNEASVTLPLLAYRDVSSKLKFYEDGILRFRVSHVAVLNHTLEKYPQGALCLLVNWEPEPDWNFTRRVQVTPAVLPHLGDLASCLYMTRLLLICPRQEKENPVETVFS
jgi:hypothetical protein